MKLLILRECNACKEMIQFSDESNSDQITIRDLINDAKSFVCSDCLLENVRNRKVSVEGCKEANHFFCLACRKPVCKVSIPCYESGHPITRINEHIESY